MTDDQVNRIVEHLCHQLHVTIRLKGAQPETFPPNIKELGFDPASVKTVLLTGLNLARVTSRQAAPETSVPIPKFATLCGAFFCELRNRKDTGNLLI